MSRFKTDESVHPDAAEFLRARGHDAVTVWDQGLRGKPDSSIAEACRMEQRSLITFDVGFADIRAYPPREFAGLIVLRLRSQSRTQTLFAIERLLSLVAVQDPARQLWVADEHSVRIRGAEEQEA